MTKRKATISSSANFPNAETLYLEELGRELGFGEAVREYEFAKPLRRKFRADLAWPSHMMLLEIDGGSFTGGRHVRGYGFTRDCEKQSIAAALGYRVFHFTYAQIADGIAFDLLALASVRLNSVRESAK
jgi:hypothetical protein